MITVFVKHYLNNSFLESLAENWLMEVNDIIQGQPGFLNFIFNERYQLNNYLDLVVQFDNQKNLDAWVEQPEHEMLLQKLKPFRIGPWYYSVIEGQSSSKPIFPNDWVEVSI